MKTLKRVISSTALLLIIGLNFAVSTPAKAVNSASNDYETVCHYNKDGNLTGFDCFNIGKKACGGCSATAPVVN